MSVAAVGAVGTIAPITPLAGAGATSGTNAASFGSAMAQGLQQVQALNDKADSLAVQAATGDLTDAHAYTIAATEANLATELTVAVRDKALAAFTQVMNMQV